MDSASRTPHPQPLSPVYRGEGRKNAEILVVLAAVVIAAASAHPVACSPNDASRLATAECLVDYHTLAIDRSTWFEQDTCDKIRPQPDGPFYSDKPPVMALMMAVPYFAAHDGLGLRAADHKELYCYSLTFLTSGLAYVVAVWGVHRLARIIGLSPGWAVALTASFALATVAPVYTRHVNSNLPTLAAAIVVLVQLKSLAQPSPGWGVGRLLLIGALGGFAYALEQPTGGLLLAASSVAVAVRLRRPSAVVWIALAALPWMVVHHVVVYSYAGTLGPPNANPAFFDYPDSQFNAANLTGRWNHAGLGAFVAYAFLLLFSTHGFVLSNPTLLLALPAAAWILMRPQLLPLPLRGRVSSGSLPPCGGGWGWGATVGDGITPHPNPPPQGGREPEAGGRLETICLGLWALGVYLLYAALSNNFGGVCCTVRWFVPLLAPAYWWLAQLLRDKPQFRIDFIVLSVWGAVLMGYFWVYGPFGDFDYQPVFRYFFWSVQAAGLLTWVVCRAAIAQNAAPPR